MISETECGCLERTRLGCSPLLLTHDPDCKHFVPTIKEVIESLVRGVEAWAGDEDGVHPDCWSAYERAKLILGETVSQSVD